MMKNRSKRILCVLLMLCLAAALFPASAFAAAKLPNPDVLVAVNPDSVSGAEAGRLVPADEALVGRILGDTDVCPESLAIFKGEEDAVMDAVVVAAVLHYARDGLTAVTMLSDGSTKAVDGCAVVEQKGEFRFGGRTAGDHSMRFGFVDEGNGKSRYYSTATLQKFNLVLGSMAKDQTLFLEGEGYVVDENGYCDANKTVEIDDLLRQRYIRATYYNGLNKQYPYDTNPFLLTKHIFDFDKAVSSRASTCKEHGELDYRCLQCGAFYSVELPLGDHQWGKWVTKNGVTQRTCKICGAVEKKSS